MTRPLRILVAHNVRRARTGGMSRIMGFIHDRVERAGHRVDYFCADDASPAGGGRWERFTFPVLVCRNVRAAFLRNRPYDIVNVHEPSGAAVALCKRLVGNPIVVVTSHGVERRGWELALEESRLGRQGPGLKTRLVYPFTLLPQADWALRLADHVFCLNSEDQAYLAARYRIAPGRSTRIFPAADALFAAAERDYTRADRLLFAGTWRKNKGIEDLVPAFTALAARYPGLTLTVLGAGAPDDAVRSAFPGPVRGRVNCVRVNGDAEAAAAFAAADVFLLPSLFEGTPLTLMEAMAGGLPVVTTVTCGMKDVIRDGVNGLLVPIRSPDAIVTAVGRLVESPAERAALGRAARAEARSRYTWDAVAAPVLSAYERLGAAR